MLKRSASTAVLAALLLACPALAADRAGDLAIINTHTPKPGAEAKYETARKAHMGWHKAQKDPWSWLTWEIVSGENSGTYYTGSFGHAWKELDGQEKLEKADEADFARGIGPTIARSYTAYYIHRLDLSVTQPTGDPPTPYSVLTFFLINPDGVNDFVDGVKKINEGIKKTSYPLTGPSGMYQLVNGGEGPMFILAGGRANWAAFAAPSKTLDAMMEEAFGKDQGAAILAKARKAIRSQRSETIKFRPDLSYMPPK